MVQVKADMTANELQLDRQEKGRYYRCKERDANVYLVLKTIVDKYVTVEKLG
jgi:hypothetical protein